MLTSTQVAEAFGRLLGARVDGLRALWDCYDGCNSPLGFAGETIHAALNERGDGAYCAV